MLQVLCCRLRPLYAGGTRTLTSVAKKDPAWSAARHILEHDHSAPDRSTVEKVRQLWDEGSRHCHLRKTLQAMAKGEKDRDMRELALQDVASVEADLEHTRTRLVAALAPPDPAWAYGATVQVQMGVGGQESGLFAGQIARMYLRWAERRGWRPRVLSFQDLLVQTTEDNAHASVAAGKPCKDAVIEINAPHAYGVLRLEGGVHRVQRIPQTESSDRIHTSTVSVAVMPIVPDSVRHKLALYEPKDLKIDVMRAGGAGGQHVNRTESAVRVTHIPTGISVRMQDSRSQHENRAKAIQAIESKLLQMRLDRERNELFRLRSSQVASVARSDKQRTYNYPQDRMTDHRLGESVHNLENVMDGGPVLDDFADMLAEQDEEIRVAACLDRIVASKK